jgi:hypothetical protein
VNASPLIILSRINRLDFLEKPGARRPDSSSGDCGSERWPASRPIGGYDPTMG